MVPDWMDTSDPHCLFCQGGPIPSVSLSLSLSTISSRSWRRPVDCTIERTNSGVQKTTRRYYGTQRGSTNEQQSTKAKIQERGSTHSNIHTHSHTHTEREETLMRSVQVHSLSHPCLERPSHSCLASHCSSHTRLHRTDKVVTARRTLLLQTH